MSRTKKDAPARVILARTPVSKKQGFHFHRDMQGVELVRKNGKAVYETVPHVYRYNSYREYVAAVENPIPHHRIPVIHGTRIDNHNKTVWAEKNPTNYFVQYCVLSTREVPVTRSYIVPFDGCTIDEVPSEENNWGRLLHCVATVPGKDAQFSKYRSEYKKISIKRNRRSVKKETSEVVKKVNTNTYDADDLYVTDFFQDNKYDWF